MLEFDADVEIYGLERGGLPRPVNNGLRPSFNYAGELVACEVWAVGVDGVVPLDRPFRARIKLPYGDQLGWKLRGGESFMLNIASQIIGEGRVVAAG